MNSGTLPNNKIKRTRICGWGKDLILLVVFDADIVMNDNIF